MLSYPSIPSWRKAKFPAHAYVFEKYDGSNLRWEWSAKRGWHKFGTRNRLFDDTDPVFAPAIPIFREKIADMVLDGVRTLHGPKMPERIIAFTEFYGENSFAGEHVEDDLKSLTLFDVSVFKKGFVGPKQFVEVWSQRSPYAAQCLYMGEVDQGWIAQWDAQMDVRPPSKRIPEGIVIKTDRFSCKAKTRRWLIELRRRKPEIFREEYQMGLEPIDNPPETS